MIEFGQKQHSVLGPSSTDRIANCPGSPALIEELGHLLESDEPEEYADEGTAAHEAAALRLWTGGYPTSTPQLVCDQLAEYIEHVESHDVILVEHRLHFKSIHPSMFGTADHLGLDFKPRREHVAYVSDLKFGAGVGVEAKGNRQMLTYAVGALELFDSVGLAPTWFDLTIAQPRYDHPEGTLRTHRVSRDEVAEHAEFLKQLVARTQEPSVLRAAGEWCRWCKARGACSTLTAKMKEFVDANPGKYSGEQVSEALRLAEIAPSWKKAVNQFAYREAQRGRPPPGWKLVPKRSRYGGFTLVPVDDPRTAVVATAGSDFEDDDVAMEWARRAREHSELERKEATAG